MRLTKIYTKVGDKGHTQLASGEKVAKTSARIESYGTVDELNAVVGMLRDQLASAATNATLFADVISHLQLIQNELFDIGGELSFPESSASAHAKNAQQVQQTHIQRLEQEIDQYNAHLKPLTNFILPGGHPYISLTHLGRTVCRRAERRYWQLRAGETVRDEIGIYLNRLSDWLFVVSRIIAERLQVPELLWQQKKS